MIKCSALAATAAGTCLVALSVAVASPAGAATSHREVHIAGSLSPAGGRSTFVSYDPRAAPLGARVAVVLADTAAGHTQVTLDVTGLLPNQGYAAHAHLNPCGATVADAGGHFQNSVGPAVSSTDPAYANSANEVWLDLQTDGDGAGHAEADVPFTFETRGPRSVVLRASGSTATDGGTADAGAACITLPTRRAGS